MNRLSRQLISSWARLGPRFLPFADAGSADLPLSRLLRLSLFQVSVGMALALLVGALNRVLIVELKVSATLVAVMVALPVLYAPLRALVGHRSDHHRCALGWRRVPFLWMGTLLQFGGLAFMPFALLVLAGAGSAQHWPQWMGQAGAAAAFLMVGAGLHTTQTAGLALATDLAPREDHPKVVGLMYVMLLLGTIVSALAFGAFLADFTPGRLVQVIQACAVATIVLNTVAMWKQESLNSAPRRSAESGTVDFGPAWRQYWQEPGVARRLVSIALGTLAFSMQDVLLEPYGGQVLAMSVGQTTWLTAALAAGGLAGFTWASHVLSRGADPARMAWVGAALGVPSFGAVILAAVSGSVPLFVFGVLGIGLAGGLFGHGTLTLTMVHASREQAGLALGTWGAVQATAAGVGVALGGVMRDTMSVFATQGYLGSALVHPATGYAFVYAVEAALLLCTVGLMARLAGISRSLSGEPGSALELRAR